MPTLYLAPGEEARVEQAIASEPSWRGRWRRVGDADAAAAGPLDFAWAHLDPGVAVRDRAAVLSLLDHVEVLSWKNNLALLQRRLGQLPTEVIMGEAHFEAWCRAEFRRAAGQQQQHGQRQQRAVWVVKDALSNGGEQVWIVSALNWRRVAAVLRAHGAAAEAAEAAERGGVGSARLYVLQRYVERPLLWPLAADLRCHRGRGSNPAAASSNPATTGRKFHWRVFGLIRGDLSCHLYPRGFAHVANAPWQPHSPQPTQAAGASQAAADPEAGQAEADPAAHREGQAAAAAAAAAAAEGEPDLEDGWGGMYDRAVHITNVTVNLQADPDGSLGVFEPYPVGARTQAIMITMGFRGSF